MAYLTHILIARFFNLGEYQIVCLGSYFCGGFVNVCPELLMFMYFCCSFPTGVLMSPLGASVVVL